MDRVVVIGGGQAGATVGSQLRANGYSGEILLVAEESVAPYERPPLSKHISHGTDLLTRPVHTDQFYVDNEIELVLGTRATALEPGRVITSGGTFASRWTVLALGSKPIALGVPGSALEGIYYLGAASDADRIASDLPGSVNVLLVGGGLINSEVAASLSGTGRSITIIDPSDQPMARTLGVRAAEYLDARHRAAGVNFVRGSIARFDGVSRVRSALATDGTTLPADLVIVGVGARPRTQLATAAGIRVSDGVDCDAFGRTSAKGVLAAGDVARWPYGGLGYFRTPHWKSAIDQAVVVAHTIAGGVDKPRIPAPWFWTDQYDDRIEVLGRPAIGEPIEVLEEPEVSGQLVTFARHSCVVGGVSINRPRDLRQVRRNVEMTMTMTMTGSDAVGLQKADY